MRRLALTVFLPLAALFFLGVPTASAAADPVVNSFRLSATSVDNTYQETTVYADVSVSAPGGLTSLVVRGVPTTTDRFEDSNNPTVSGELSAAVTPTLRGRIPIRVKAGHMRTYRLQLTANGPGGSSDLPLGATLTTKVTAAPKAPTALRVNKVWLHGAVGFYPGHWSPSVDAGWTWQRDGATPIGNRTTGSGGGCGSNVWYAGGVEYTSSANPTALLPCTVTVRLVNDFGESPAVTATVY